MKRRTPPAELTEAFRHAGLSRYALPVDGPLDVLRECSSACWLHQHDPYHRPCGGRLEVFHFIGRQRIRNSFGALLAAELLKPIPAFAPDDVTDLVELAEWDPRNAGPGCTLHHRRLDSHATPGLILPPATLPLPVLQFISERGLESEAGRKFPGAGQVLAEAA